MTSAMMSDEAPLKTKKKLPFKPTALRKTAAAPKSTPVKHKDGTDNKSDDDGLDLFRQSREMAPIMTADRERRLRRKQRQEEERQRQLAAAQDKGKSVDDTVDTLQTMDDTIEEQGDLGGRQGEETPALDESPTVDGDGFGRELVTPPPSKRSRLGSENGTRSSKRQRGAVDVLDDPFDDSPSKPSLCSHAKLSTPSRRPRNGAFTPSGAPLISLDSDSDDEVRVVESPSKRHGDSGVEIVDSVSPAPTPAAMPLAPVQVEDEEEEEEEFNEYIRKAEEQRARNKAMLQTDSNGASKKSEATDIMITSDIPGSHVAYLRYQFDRPLRLVRDSWIALQCRKGVQLPITQDDDIVLTWKRKKVYASSTLLSLDIRPPAQGDGRIFADDDGKEGPAEQRSKVHMEAWTTELFQEMESERERRQRRDAGDLSDEESADEEPEAERVRLRIKLKARGMEEVKLTVLLETTVETLVTGFRTQRGIGLDKDVGIWFDGARLEEHDTMESAEIDDMDTLEVHIKE